MEVLEKEDITPEIAEKILDKVHLAMSKENPDWQVWAMDEDLEDWQEYELNTLSRNGLLLVLRNSKKELSFDAGIKLAKEFRGLGANFLSDFLIGRSKFQKDSEEKEKNRTDKSVFLSPISNILKSEPNLSQVRACNYKKTHIRIPITIENKKGSYRSGTDTNGNTWRNKLYHDYGYIKRTKDANGDHVDVFIGPDRESRVVFVINQQTQNGSFDEHKCMLGFHDEKAARAGYLKNYNKNWKGLGSIATLTISQFEEWLEFGNTRRELKDPKIEFLKSDLFFLKESLNSLPVFLENRKSDRFLFEVHKSDPIRTFLPFSEKEKRGFNLFEIRKTVEKSNRELRSIRKAALGQTTEPIGTRNLWNDGYYHEKTYEGWKTVSEPKKETPKKERRPRNKKIERPKKGHTNPTSLPFPKICVIGQYTKKEDYDRSQIDSLKQKIYKNGYDPSFPMTVDFKDGQWTVVAGHHRYEAVKELIREGKLHSNFQIPVVTKEFADDNSRLAAQISENHRRNVLPTDEAIAYGKLVKDGWDIKRISEELGIKVGEIQKRLSLNNLTPELFRLVHKKDRSLPLGIAEVIGTYCKDANDKPNSTIQIKAFRWYQENRAKYGSRGPSVLQEYIKELLSSEFENFDFDTVATNVQKEALRTIGSKEKASANKKMLEVMVDNLMKTYNRVLGDNITSLSPDVTKELAASLALTSDKGVDSVALLGKLGVIIQDLTLIKNSIQNKLKEIEDDSSIPMLFARSFLFDIDEAIVLSNVIKTEIAA
ncbi:ParB N-terminal domain-containing protein [Leptospira santarosai]|uniref:ParB N-terminal domain-containing protein n=1 Tax=Leptospira santarosai TaxID=28183 RepID=UPI0002976061|nr:ParB N-terminal domain-containing protein [Leptospira santarosai]EKS06916.1 ParB-like protein [Leptospira santarosai str. JET]